jgi:large-conductance mechanosensitive channel
MLTWHVYVYFVAFLIIAISGIYIQCKYFNKSEEEKQKEEHEAQEKLIANQHQPAQH